MDRPNTHQYLVLPKLQRYFINVTSNATIKVKIKTLNSVSKLLYEKGSNKRNQGKK